MKKTFVLILVMIMLVSSLTACANEPTTVEPAVEEPAAEVPVVEEIDSEEEIASEDQQEVTLSDRFPKVTIALGTDPVELSPINYNQKTDIAQAVYETLFDLDGGIYVPRLAKSFTEIDSLHWDVELYDYIHDSQGNNITADDVVYSYDYLIESGQYFKYDLFESVEKVDDYIVRFTWTAPVDVVGGLEHPLCRTIIFSKAAMDGGDFATAPVGTGPYTVTEFVGGSKIVLEANDDYWQKDESLKSYRQLQNVQTIEYQIISEPVQHVIALESKTIDISSQVPAESISEFQDGGEYANDYDVFAWL